MFKRKGFWAIVLLCLMVVLTGCGKKDEQPPAGEQKVKMSVDQVYADITDALTAAYEEAGKPKVNWDGMTKVKETTFPKLNMRFSEWPQGTSFSLSVMDDHIVVYVNVDGNEKEGQWKP